MKTLVPEGALGGGAAALGLEIGGAMKKIRLAKVYWPEAIIPPASMALGIVLAFGLIMFKLDGSPMHLFSIIPAMNGSKKLADVLLVLIPLGSLYFLLGLYFSYNILRRTVDIPETMYLMCFMVPYVFLMVAQLSMCLYYATDRDAVLSGDAYNWISGCVTAAIICLVWIEGFMAFARSAKEAD